MIPLRLLVTLLPLLTLSVTAAPAGAGHAAKRSKPKQCKRPAGSPSPSASSAPAPVPTGAGQNAGAGGPGVDSAIKGAPTGASGGAGGPASPTGGAASPTDDAAGTAATGGGSASTASGVTSATVAPTGAGSGTPNPAPAPNPTGSGSPTVPKQGDLGECPPAPAGMEKGPLAEGKRYVGYWFVTHGTSKEGEDTIFPSASQVKGMTHVILAFVDAKADFQSWQYSWATNWSSSAALDLKRDNPGLKVLGAFGGWNQDAFFRAETSTEAGRQGLANKMVKAAETLHLDGIDLDWEFPVGNGEVYKQPGQENNPYERFWFVDLVYKLRLGLGRDSSSQVDLALAFDEETVPALEKGIDFFNLMTYDLMNRRDDVAGHHSGGGAMLKTIKAYKDRGMKGEMMNVGFPMYAKWFEGGADAPCDPKNPIGCQFKPNSFEATDGTDTGHSGVYIINKAFMTPQYLGDGYAAIQSKVENSWATAQANPIADAAQMATSAWDQKNGIFWTWLSAQDTEASCVAVTKEVNGVFAWSINQDERGVAGGPRFDALQKCIGN